MAEFTHSMGHLLKFVSWGLRMFRVKKEEIKKADKDGDLGPHPSSAAQPPYCPLTMKLVCSRPLTTGLSGFEAT
jgi:hypothetical protein